MSFTDIKLNIIYRNMRGIWSSWHRFNGVHAYSREYHYQHSVNIRFYSSYPIKLRVTENYFQWFSLFISILRCMSSYLVLLYLSISQDVAMFHITALNITLLGKKRNTKGRSGDLKNVRESTKNTIHKRLCSLLLKLSYIIISIIFKWHFDVQFVFKQTTTLLKDESMPTCFIPHRNFNQNISF